MTLAGTCLAEVGTMVMVTPGGEAVRGDQVNEIGNFREDAVKDRRVRVIYGVSPDGPMSLTVCVVAPATWVRGVPMEGGEVTMVSLVGVAAIRRAVASTGQQK